MANPYPVPVSTGQKFGKWTVIIELSPLPKKGKGAVRLIECKCVCGTVKPVRLIHLRSGKSGGCRKCADQPVRLSAGRNPGARYLATNRTYRIYRSMISRCTFSTATGWNRYGGRGINVCQRWRENYDNFVADMGEAPAGLSIDRINNDGDYTPENCRWATDVQQRANKSRNGKAPKPRPLMLAP
jgi:hypothetical protein